MLAVAAAGTGPGFGILRESCGNPGPGILREYRDGGGKEGEKGGHRLRTSRDIPGQRPRVREVQAGLGPAPHSRGLEKRPGSGAGMGAEAKILCDPKILYDPKILCDPKIFL